MKLEPIKTYACYLRDDDVRMSSSSGAVFSAVASYIFSLGGVVYGVAMTEDCYSAEFISVTDEEGLKKLRGSKYLQAKFGNTYKSVKKDLMDGKVVLFTGTGCQINGLKIFLQKDYDNLICIDVICHGTPSPALWEKYAQYQEQKNGGKLTYVDFRCKDENWTNFGMKEAIGQEENIKQNYISKGTDSYMQMFLRDYCLRPSCYECVAKDAKQSDLTIADFWGIDKVDSGMNDGKGTSLVLIRTEKGQMIFDVVSGQMKLKEVSYEDGVRGNPAEYRSCARPMQRDTFFDDMHRMSFDELEKKYAAPIKVSFVTRVKRKIKKTIKSILRVSGGERVNNADYGLLFVFRI